MLARVKNLFKFFLGIPLTLVALYFIFNFIYSNRHDVLQHLGDINILPFSFGIIFLIIFFFLRSLAWHQILKREGYEDAKTKSIYLLAASEIKRYVPGSVLGFISRVNNFSSEKVPGNVIIKLIFYESIIFLASSVITSIPGIYFVLNKAGDLPSVYYLAVFSLIAIITLAAAIVFFRVSRKYSLNIKLFLKKIPEFRDSFLLILVAWIFFGIGNYLLGVSFYYLDPRLFVELSSFFILSWLIGYVVIVVPLGLGVREAAVVYGLSSLMPAGFAAALSVILRIGLIIAELVFLLIAYFSYRFRTFIPKVKLEIILLWSSIISYFTYFTYLSIEKHLNFFSGRFDLGNMDQTVWNTIHGRIFLLTNPDGTENILRLGVHADFILILLSPFYLIWEDPRMLLIIQTAVLALGAFFVYKIAEHVLAKQTFLPLIFAISYLLNPWVQRQNLFDFHAVTLATTFLLGTAFYMITKKYKYFFVFLVLALLTKEHVYLVGLLFGLYLFIKEQDKKWLVLSTVSGIAFYLLITKLIPLARGGTHFAINYFSVFGDSLPEIFKNSLLNPALTFSLIATPQSIEYLARLLIPVGFLSVLSPVMLIFTLPDLAVNILSSNDNFMAIYYHYAAVIIPFIYVSAIYGAKRILNLRIKHISTFLAIYVATTSIFATYELGVLPGSKSPSIEVYTRHLEEREKISHFLEGIHPDLSVAATNNLGSHLSHRDKIYTLPIGAREADVVVLLFPDNNSGNDTLRAIDVNLRYDADYIEVYRIGGFSAFAKIEAAYKITTPY